MTSIPKSLVADDARLDIAKDILQKVEVSILCVCVCDVEVSIIIYVLNIIVRTFVFQL